MTLAATAIAGFPAIRLLRRLNVGKEISEWGPESHQVKAGTPTMGGLLIIAAIAVFTLAANLFGRYSIGLPLAVMGALALLGFVDDLGSLQGREQHALSKRVKLLAFVAIGVAAAVGLYEFLDLNAVNVPYDGRRDIGALYFAIAVAVVVLTAGGVAVTDGLDGLVAGASAIAFGAYGFIALAQGQDYLGAFCFTVTGAVLGFLWHNSHPAQVFMGDTGALALGGGLAVVAFMTGQWLVLPAIGVVFLAEGASTYLQIGYYKLSGGRRIFRMAPLHHHFEQSGWHEVQVAQRFWIVGALGGALGVILALEV
ncbi:MAG: phospho-N-acetylmuramoyl-pentapeptide-transferase [Dehalococcoidia bacterium]|nr:phospho-N-acetylmuramoyl-pentapeptide-transferase [Dehalococcoidia bacterium]